MKFAMLKNEFLSKTTVSLGIYLLFAVFCRAVPGFPNISAYPSLCLMIGLQFSRTQTLMTVLISAAFSDLMLAFLHQGPIWGSWTFFTYTGFLANALWVRRYKDSMNMRLLLKYSFFSSLGFWLWTNLGVWLSSGLYSHQIDGFWLCYTLALPFLAYSLLGNLFWTLVLGRMLKPFKRDVIVNFKQFLQHST